MIYSGYMPVNQDRADEWDESAENEPLEECEHCGAAYPADEFENGACPDCRETEEPGDEQCADIFEQVEQAPLVKPTGPCVELNNNGVTWRV